MNKTCISKHRFTPPVTPIQPRQPWMQYHTLHFNIPFDLYQIRQFPPQSNKFATRWPNVFKICIWIRDPPTGSRELHFAAPSSALARHRFFPTSTPAPSGDGLVILESSAGNCNLQLMGPQRVHFRVTAAPSPLVVALEMVVLLRDIERQRCMQFWAVPKYSML